MKERFLGFTTIYGAQGEHETPYLTRIWIGRLRMHIFHRGDADPDPHDHPWDFWTFPLTAYVEEVAIKTPRSAVTFRQTVPAWRWSFRPAEHTHRVLGRYDLLATTEAALRAFIVGSGRVPPQYGPGKIITVVWQGRPRRKWGFLRNRDGAWCWTPWKDYVFAGGKHAPCEPSDGGA
ncbi:hypothetical protein [Mesorhizobium sp. M0522]|uniref:hypothetical protein n=1 Tax=Mesorhizobium sp. M0522 TaxID=2956958 RepID=UPI003335A6A5